MRTLPKKKGYLYGLNTLRFIAAFFIIAMHIQYNQKVMGLPTLPKYAFLGKGAVSFFFTLSGFLITYIRLGEYDKTGSMDLKKFFKNRFFRLAPVYYLVIISGLFFYWAVLPKLGVGFDLGYSLSTATLLYSLFLPNLMNSLYHVGGILNVSWSIGAQEQFYFFFLPFIKKYMNYIQVFLWILIAISIVVNIANALDAFPISEGWKWFINTLRFHFMGIGAILGYYLKYKKEQLLSLWVFSKKWLQLFLAALLVAWYSFKTSSQLINATVTFPLSFLYGWLIINVSSNPKNIIRIDHKILDWIGQRTYGIYMYHMFVVYAVTFFFVKTQFLQEHYAAYMAVFYTLVFGITIGLSHLSYTYMEQPIISWHHKRRTLKKIASES